MALPALTDFIGTGISKGTFKGALTGLRAYLSALLGESGTAKDARKALGASFAQSTTKTGAYTVVAADRGKVISCSGTWTLSLTAATTLGDGFLVCIANTGSGVITIDPNLSELIGDAATLGLDAGTSVLVYCDGTKFVAFGQGKKLTRSAMAEANTYAAGENYVSPSSAGGATSSTADVEVLNFRMLAGGTFRCSFVLKSSFQSAFARIYKNGVAFGTQRSTTSTTGTVFSEDLSFSAGDSVQLFVRASSGTATASSFRIGTDVKAVTAITESMSIGDR